MLVDSHAHTFDLKKGYVVPPDIIPVVVGYSHGSNQKAAKEAKAHGWPLVLGIAPQTAIREDISKLDEWVSFIRESKPNAIGEIGLDYKWAKDAADIEKERKVFARMLSLANEMKLPIVIHSRNRPAPDAKETGGNEGNAEQGVPENAVDDILEMLAPGGKALAPFVMHFYSGNEKQAERIVSLGGYISVTLMRSKEKRKVINIVPLERILVETDSPFVGRTPEAARDAAAYVAEVKGLEVSEVEKATAENAKKFFGF